MKSKPKLLDLGQEGRPLGSADRQEDLDALRRNLYLAYQFQPRVAMTLDERREAAAYLRHECERLDQPIPPWLREWHPGVVYHDDGHLTYDDPNDSPEPPPPQYPEAQDLDREAEADLARWERKALTKARAGKRPVVSFDSEHIPAPVAEYVRAELAKCAGPDDVKALFAFFDE